MGSTIRTSVPSIPLQAGAASLRWRSWPLMDGLTWSWSVLLGVLIVGGFAIWYGSPLVAVAVAAALAVVLWQFFLPVTYEVTSLGLRRYALGRIRLVPWQAVRAYQLRPTGVVFFQNANPTRADQLISLFVPYPEDEDEMLVAVRLYLPHAAEVPRHA
jgi:hypothetical protein